MTEDLIPYVLLTVLLLVVALLVYGAQLRRQGLEAIVKVPYRRARMLYRQERTLSKKGISLAEHMESASGVNPARKRIAMEKDARLLALYRERCMNGETEISLSDADQRSFDDEARRIDAFYPDRPNAI